MAWVVECEQCVGVHVDGEETTDGLLLLAGYGPGLLVLDRAERTALDRCAQCVQPRSCSLLAHGALPLMGSATALCALSVEIMRRSLLTMVKAM